MFRIFRIFGFLDFWILDFGYMYCLLGFWILDFGFWILDFGFWILRILDFGFWILMECVRGPTSENLCTQKGFSLLVDMLLNSKLLHCIPSGKVGNQTLVWATQIFCLPTTWVGLACLCLVVGRSVGIVVVVFSSQLGSIALPCLSSTKLHSCFA